MQNKEVRLNIRIGEATIADLKTTARLRGLSVSSLVNMLVAKVIREEKAAAPEEFGLEDKPLGYSGGLRPGRGDWREAMANVRGIWKDRDDLPEFFDELRNEWNRDLWSRDEE